MAKIRFTKNELRDQQHFLSQLERYLPTLRLKKAMLQAQVQEAKEELARLSEAFVKLRHDAEEWASLLTVRAPVDFQAMAKVKRLHKRYENIAGVEIPYYERVTFEDFFYGLFETPPWMDRVVAATRSIVEARLRIVVCQEKKSVLERELREVSIRVNLFEKVLIPRTEGNIRRIKVFLGDQELSAVSQAKVAKSKIEARL